MQNTDEKDSDTDVIASTCSHLDKTIAPRTYRIKLFWPVSQSANRKTGKVRAIKLIRNGVSTAYDAEKVLRGIKILR